MDGKILRDIRYLKLYALGTSLALLLLMLTGFASEQKARFTEIDVERINVVEKDGRLVLVMANADRIPPPIVGGHTFERQGARSPGFLFYNSKGDEVGGLVFGSRTLPDGGYQAGAALLFDQYNQDQTVGITYNDSSGRRSAGLTVWDRPDTPVWDIVGPILALPEGPERNALIQKKAAEGELGAVRLFVGKRADRSALLSLADARGKPRLQISVDADGNPRIAFLDENGKAVYSLPPAE